VCVCVCVCVCECVYDYHTWPHSPVHGELLWHKVIVASLSKFQSINSYHLTMSFLFFICLVFFFFIFTNLGISYFHFDCYSFSRFPGQQPPSPSPSLPPHPLLPSSQQSLSLGVQFARTKGFPFHWCSY